MNDVGHPKGRRRLPVVFTQDELLHLFDCLPEGEQRLVMQLLYGTGMRIMEAVRLQLGGGAVRSPLDALAAWLPPRGEMTVVDEQGAGMASSEPASRTPMKMKARMPAAAYRVAHVPGDCPAAKGVDALRGWLAAEGTRGGCQVTAQPSALYRAVPVTAAGVRATAPLPPWRTEALAP